VGGPIVQKCFTSDFLIANNKSPGFRVVPEKLGGLKCDFIPPDSPRQNIKVLNFPQAVSPKLLGFTMDIDEILTGLVFVEQDQPNGKVLKFAREQ
jgi:hypothetical protein